MSIMESMSSWLAGLARYSGSDRLYALEFTASDNTLVVERWQGWEVLSDGFEWWVDALSDDALLRLDDLLGQRATFWTRTADGTRLPRTGLVREAACIGADGGLARYRLCLAPWTWLLTQGRHSRVYADKTVVQIVEAVLAGYAPFAAWQVGEEVGPFLADARPRSYCVQYRESDFAFVSRLLAEEGLGWRIEEAEDTPAGHRMVLFAHSDQGPEDATAQAGHGIRFHRSDGTEGSDTIQALGVLHRLGSSALSLASHDYKSAASHTSLSLSDQSEAALELYDPAGAYAFADQAQAARHARLQAEALQARQQRWVGQSTVRSFRAGQWFAVRQAPQQGDHSGPELLLVAVHQAGINNLPDTVRDDVATRLGPAQPMVAPSPEAGDWSSVRARASQVGYANAFVAVPRDRPWRPILTDGTGARLNPRPTAPGYQTALVVGSDDTGKSQELHSDALGRLRVRFHFQNAHGQDDSNAGAANQSCWLRVAQSYAGPGVGSQFLPRIGQEVLVAFLDGDIDRPVIVGSLYNGYGEAGIAPTPGAKETTSDSAAYADAADHRPSAQANLQGGHAPAWHGMSGDDAGHRNPAAMSGFKSREFGGDGHSRLVFDDSDGQLRLQLATTHAATQLTMGHLIHQADNYRGTFRGEGFELRTDRWGAIRGERGLWISAYGNDPDAPAGEHIAATALLKQATKLGQAFSDIAGTHLTVPLAAHQGASKSNQSVLINDAAPLRALHTSAATTVDGKAYPSGAADASNRSPTAGEARVPHSGDALLGLSAPAGVAMIAGQSLHWSVGETLTLASGQSTNAAIAGDLRIHTGQAIGWLANAVESQQPTATHALALVTAEGELDLQAQHDQLKLQSKDQLQMISANAEVELAAGKTVHLATSGGASITIEGGNMTMQCPGEIVVHAQKKSFVGGAHLSREMNAWPQAKFARGWRAEFDDGTPMKHYKYEITRRDGAIVSGRTDEDGMIPMQQGMDLERVTVKLFKHRSEDQS